MEQAEKKKKAKSRREKGENQKQKLTFCKSWQAIAVERLTELRVELDGR